MVRYKGGALMIGISAPIEESLVSSMDFIPHSTLGYDEKSAVCNLDEGPNQNTTMLAP